MEIIVIVSSNPRLLLTVLLCETRDGKLFDVRMKSEPFATRAYFLIKDFKHSPRLLCRREQTKTLLSLLRIFGERQREREEAIFQLLKHSRMRIIC